MTAESRLEALESKLEEFERNCCNKTLIETSAREALLLEQMLTKLDGVITRQDKHEKFMYMLVGGFVLFEYLGLGSNLLALLKG